MTAGPDTDDHAAPDIYRQMREDTQNARVVPSDGGPYGDGPGALVLGYDEAAQVLRDWQVYSSSVHARLDEFRGVTIRQMDGDLHRRHRALVSYAFRPSVVERWEQEAVRPVLTELLDNIAPRGHAELVSEVTASYPIQVICKVLGIPPDSYEQFIVWAEGITHGMMNPEAGMAAKDELGAWLQPYVEQRREQPCGDLLSDLVTAEVDGERLDDDHVYGFLRLLIPAGAETTFRAMGNVLFALLTHPEVLDDVRAHPERLPAVIEETLRWETSIPMTLRTTTEDTELDGCPLQAGTNVLVVLGAADRDEARWSDPDRWDPARESHPNLAFGFGPHHCLGIHLARMELQVGVQSVLERLPHLRLDPADVTPAIEGQAFRGPTRLPVLFDPS